MSSVRKPAVKHSRAIAVRVSPAGREPLRAVMLERTPTGFELVWRKQAPAGTDPVRFVADLAAAAAVPEGEVPPVVAVGLDSSLLGFYRLELPPVRDSQLQSVVRMQAEAVLPLPADQMRLAWRVENAAGERRLCTLAAVRKDALDPLLTGLRSAGVQAVIPDCEGAVVGWRRLLGGSDQRSVLLHVRDADTRLLLCENGRLIHAITLDVGGDDLAGTEAAGETVELFVHDLRNALERFDVAAEAAQGIHVLSQAAGSNGSMIAHLKQAGISAQPAGAAGHALHSRDRLDQAELIEYLEPIGTAMLVLDDGLNRLDMYAQEDYAQRVPRGFRAFIPAIAAVAAAVMLVVLLITAKATDEAELAKIKTTRLAELHQQYQVRYTVAQQRPDLLDLLNRINDSMKEGMLLDNFVFQKLQKPVEIAGFAQSYEQLYEFEKALASQKDISDVKIQSPTWDDRNNRVSFRMTFYYKNFGKGK